MVKKFSPILFCVMVLLCVFALGSSSLVSASTLGALTPTDDTYIDRNSPTNNFNNQLLLVEQGLPIGSSSEQTNRAAYFKFDLTSETEEITSATFTLGPVTGACVGAWNGSITLDIYGVSVDAWAEDLLTWDSANMASMMDPANLTLLGIATFDATAGLWTLIHADLVTWIEAERLGDSTATVMAQMSTGFAPETAFFEDSEGTGAGAGCIVPASGVPLMDLGSAPLSVSLVDAESGSGNVSWIGWIAVMLGLLFLVGLTAVFHHHNNNQPKPIPIPIRRED